MRIMLVRHGETPWNAEGRYQGHKDIPLSSVGEAQAKALGQRLAQITITHALASPLTRAQRTARLALGAQREGLLKTDEDLSELNHGDWEGCLASDLRDQDPERLAAWYAEPHTVVMPGGGESLHHLQERSWRAFAKAVQGLAEQDLLLVVAHDAVNRVILSHILGLPLSQFWRFRQAPTTINLLEGPALDHLYIVRLNDCTHHTALFGEAHHRAL